MSEATPQLALLLTTAQQPGMLPGSVRPGAPGVGASPQGGSDFQAYLNDLLSAVRQDAPVTAPGTGAAGFPATPGMPLSPAAAADAGETLPPDGTASAAGNNLPPGGNNLPLTAVLPATDAALVPGAQVRRPASPIAPASGGRPLPASSSASGGSAAAGIMMTGAAPAAAAGDRAAADPPAGAEGESALDTAVAVANRARSAAPDVSTAAARVFAARADAGGAGEAGVGGAVADVMRQFGLQARGVAQSEPRAARSADIVALAAEQGGDVLSPRADSGRVAAAGESHAAQFNLHTRPLDALLQPGAAQASPEAVLRDLQSMLPLRPQTGSEPNAWSAGLGQRLVMMAENGLETARLQLNPAHLGPLEVHVNVDDDRAQVWFGAQNNLTREVLEAALPRLREMFAAQGLQLTDADVGPQGGRDQAPGESPGPAPLVTGAMASASAGAVTGLPDAVMQLPDGRPAGLDIYV